MNLENDPKPTWTDPAPTIATPTPAGPAAAAIPVAPAAVTQQKKSGAWANILLGAAAIIAVGGVAFAIGRSTAPAAAAGVGTFGRGGNGVVLTPGGSFDPNDPSAGGFAGRGRFGSGGPIIDGKVASVSAESMTITLASGDSMTVALDGSTTYHQSTTASGSDVAVGDQVGVRINGGRFPVGGNGNGGTGGGNPDGSTTPALTATDVTVSR